MKKTMLGINIMLFLLIAGCSSVPVSKEAITKSTQNERVVSVLNDLIQVDIDTYHAYTQAIQALSSSQLTQTLKAFREEHEQHIKVLSKIVLVRGGIPPEFSRDFKGYIISGYTAIKVKGSVYSIFQAMESNEALSVMYHNDALKVDLPSDVKRVIQIHCETEKSHLACLTEMKKQV